MSNHIDQQTSASQSGCPVLARLVLSDTVVVGPRLVLLEVLDTGGVGLSIYNSSTSRFLIEQCRYCTEIAEFIWFISFTSGKYLILPYPGIVPMVCDGTCAMRTSTIENNSAYPKVIYQLDKYTTY